MTMQLVLCSDDGRQYPVHLEGQPFDIEPLDFTRVSDLLKLGAAVSDVHADAIRAKAIRGRREAARRVGNLPFGLIDGALAVDS